MEICSISGHPVARYNGCTNARCIWKGSWGEGEPKNVNLETVQKAHRPERASKLLRFLHRRLWPWTKIYANSGLPVAQYNGCTNARCIWKGSYSDGEPKNVNPNRKGPANYSIPCSAVYSREWKFAQTRGFLSSGTMAAPMQGAYEKEAMGKENLKM